MTRAYVYTVLPSLFSSMKLSSTGQIIGTFLQDRATAIAGKLGPGPHMIPLSLTLESRHAEKHTFHFGIVNDQLFGPLMTYATILNSLGSYGPQRSSQGAAPHVPRRSGNPDGSDRYSGERERRAVDSGVGRHAPRSDGTARDASAAAAQRRSDDQGAQQGAPQQYALRQAARLRGRRHRQRRDAVVAAAVGPRRAGGRPQRRQLQPVAQRHARRVGNRDRARRQRLAHADHLGVAELTVGRLGNRVIW